MHTTAFLQSASLEDLCARFAIKVRRHSAHPNLVQLKYDQRLSPMDEPVVRECRGLILDEADGWRVVCRAYDKFFNHGEPHAAPIDWSTARVYDKLDGSLMTLYPYARRWHVASSAVPDAAGRAHKSGLTFAQLFEQTWARLGYHLPDTADARCFMFELMTPDNPIIVRHAKPRLVLHGVRDLTTMAELDPDPFAAHYGWECVRSLPLSTIDDCLAAAAELRPTHGEGYVVRDAAFRRVKVKSPHYVALAHIKEAMTGRRLLEIVRANESDEFLAYFPEFRPAYDAARAAFDVLCAELEADYHRLSSIPDQRAFAAEAAKTRCSSPLFALRAGKAPNVRAFFASATIQLLERALGVDPATFLDRGDPDDA